ncbi:MAG: GNAT family N-acetyltransferase [Synergistaceae bacterium]|nr:GNAT family N-acetyltransferase [Synergistaceae bacterium]
MMIKTKRLNIYPASREQMKCLIQKETSPDLKQAYQEMLDGGQLHLDQWEWYAIWNIELNDGSNKVIGNLSFKGLPEDGITEIGYGMKSEYEGQGYMTEALYAVVKWASVQNGVRLIEAETEENNVASKRVLFKAGFIPNGKMGLEGARYVWKEQRLKLNSNQE